MIGIYAEGVRVCGDGDWHLCVCRDDWHLGVGGLEYIYVELFLGISAGIFLLAGAPR